ncbi:MAG: leucine-rich repeat domain-containing protein [Chloroflexi bacterium]|nr:leucine-rich repeat domain-containing protein [Chloroflexota bacterium]
MYDNQLTSVPSEIGNLTNLTRLYLNNNQLTAVPSEIVNLTNLTHLSLRDNQLTSLPLEIDNLTSLTDIQLHSNPLSGPMPTELTNLTNLSRIVFYNTFWCTPDTPAFNAWLDSISEVQGTGFVCGQNPGAISGIVSAATPVTGIQAALYRDIDPGWSEWILVDTAPVNNVGQYVFNNLGEGIEYRVHFEDETGNYAPEYYDNVSTISAATSVTVTLGMTRTDLNTFLELPQPPIVDVDTDSGSVNVNPLDGTVTVNMTQGNRSDITVTRMVTCTGSVTPSLVELQLEMSTETSTYTMLSIGNDQYQVTIPEVDIVADTTLKIKATCGGLNETTTVGTVNLYDPSGNITDMFTHQPIVGATVTLYEVPNWRPRTSPSDTAINSCESNDSKAAGLPWSQHAPTDEGVIVNTELTTVVPLLSHQQTDADGHYGWDVQKGCWYVVVRADGYETLTSPVVGIPPEVTDLDLALAPEGSSIIFLPMIVK